MPRRPRLDAPQVLHHVRFRGGERHEIFIDDRDREDFLERLGVLMGKKKAPFQETDEVLSRFGATGRGGPAKVREVHG